MDWTARPLRIKMPSGSGAPPKQLKLVRALIEIHKEELEADRLLAVTGEEPFRIAPLQ